MATINCGPVEDFKFGDKVEPRFEVALGGLPVAYSVLKPYRNINPDDKYKLSLKLNAEQFEEVKAAMLERLGELNVAGAFGATAKQLDELLARAVGESTKEDGVFRFYGSKRMGFKDKDEMLARRMLCVDGETKEAIEGGVSLGAGSVVRSVFSVSLFKKDKQVLLKIEPTRVVVIKLVEPPKRESISHDGLADSYDY